MNELEKELLQTFLNFVTQYEADKKQQAEQIENLIKQIQTLQGSINNLNNSVEQLQRAYLDITNVLEE